MRLTAATPTTAAAVLLVSQLNLTESAVVRVLAEGHVSPQAQALEFALLFAGLYGITRAVQSRESRRLARQVAEAARKAKVATQCGNCVVEGSAVGNYATRRDDAVLGRGDGAAAAEPDIVDGAPQRLHPAARHQHRDQSGKRGGEIVAQGTPRDITRAKASMTGQLLKVVLK
mgnify:CR=1 FL=1